MSIADQLRNEVFGCELCTGVAAFKRPAASAPFYKFPPIIGAQGPAKLLFIGINPRRTASNLKLHDWLAQSVEAFSLLATNRQRDGHPYIRLAGDEPHYHCHMAIVKGVFDVQTNFESVAAVTELLLCASESEPTMLSKGKSPCAERYLARVMGIVQPRVVIAVGSGVYRHLKQHFRETVSPPIVRMEHPRQLQGASPEVKAAKLRPTISQVIQILKGQEGEDRGTAGYERAARAQG